MNYKSFKKQHDKPWFQRDVPTKPVYSVLAIVFVIFAITDVWKHGLPKPQTAASKAQDAASDAQEARAERLEDLIRAAKPATAVICEREMTRNLKSPTSAEFPSNQDVVSMDGNKTFTMASYVDAQNAFGTMIRMNFVCQVTYNGGDPDELGSWALKGISTF